MGLTGGAPGVILSPISLFICNKFTPYEQKQKNGKSVTVTAWAAWVAAGIIATPILWIFNAMQAPEASKQTESKADAVAAQFANGDGDFTETLRVWMDKYPITGRWRCEDAIKDVLKDPKSMETRKVTYHAAPNLAVEPPMWRTRVAVVFGARNGFGGMTMGTGRCLFDKNGDLVAFEGIES